MNKQLVGSLSSQQLRRALEIKEKIQSLESELGAILGYTAPAAAPVPIPAKTGGQRGDRRSMSPEARARVVAAQKLRWSKVRAKAKATGSAKPAKVVKRKVSPAVRARLAELAKARWAKVKASGKSRL